MRFLLFFLLLIFFSVEALAKKQIMNIGYSVSEGHPYGTFMFTFADRLEKFSANLESGAIKVNVHCCQKKGSEQEMFRKLQLGTLDGTLIAQNNAGPFYPKLDLLVMPYFFQNYEHAVAVADGPIGQEIWGNMANDIGVHLVTIALFSFRHIYNTKMPINNLSDFSRMKYRVPKNVVMIDTYKAFGSNPVPINWSEALTALQMGVVDGGDLPIDVMYSQKFHHVAKHVAETGHFTLAPPFFVSDKFMKKLSSEQKDALYMAAKLAADASRNHTNHGMSIVKEKMIQAGVKFTSPDRAPWIESAMKIHKSFVSERGNDYFNILNKVYALTNSKQNNINEKIISIPENAFADGSSWKCKSGYEKVGNTCKTKVSSEELIAAQQKAAELEQQLANLLFQKQKQQQKISQDNQIPLIDILSSISSGKQGIIKGRATDNIEVAEVTINGKTIPIDTSGYFEHTTYIREGGTTLTIEAFDMAGLSSIVNVSLERNDVIVSNAITFDPLNPLGKTVSQNNEALALIIGVSDYENINAQAVYADSDAKMFSDYATDILGIPSKRIKTLINNGADITGILLSIKDWLKRSTKKGETDIYIFFAGHGLASDNGEEMYLLPYDGSPRLLERTSILRKELFKDIASTNPRSVTVFLDTCYSGTTRGTDMLIASRPIAIVAKEQAIPNNFTVFTAAAGDQTAKPLEEAKHGLFSYFLMKGMEGHADSNNDDSITAGELHAYVQQNVIKHSGGSQISELQGDAKKVLIQFK